MARRIERAYEKAIENKELLKAALNAVPGIDSTMVDAILPFIPELNLDEDKKLYGAGGIFRTRADYERNLRYLDRLNRAIGSEWTGRGTTTFEGILPTQVTSFYVSDDSIQTEFMRREQSLAERNRNRENMQRLAERGILMEKVPVYKSYDTETGEGVVLYDENRHPVMRYVPKTPEMSRRYFYEVQKQQGLEIIQPDVPVDAVYEQFGDVVPVDKSVKRTISKANMKQALSRDAYRQDSTELYFRNMKAIIDTTLPDNISSKFNDVFNQILKENPKDMYELYRMIDAEAGDDIASLDFLYRDNAIKASAKINQIYKVFKDKIAPRLSSKVNMENISTAEEWEEQLADIPALSEGQNIYSEYQRRKKEGEASSVTMEELKQLRGY